LRAYTGQQGKEINMLSPPAGQHVAIIYTTFFIQAALTGEDEIAFRLMARL
jgi:hypothetical protein